MMKKTILGFITCVIIIMAISGCTKTQPNADKPDVHSSPISAVDSIKQTAGPQEPQEDAEPLTAPAEDVLGFDLPVADADGHRTYRWHDQIVEDWLGDFEQASEIRNIMLTRLDGKQKDDYYILFLGRPLEVEGGWLMPAGKRTDGEWLPALFYIAADSTGLHIQSKAENYVWTLNRTCIPLMSGECTSFFGVASILGTDSKALPIRAEATFADGTKAQGDMPKGYPYLFLIHPGNSLITDLVYFDAQSGAPLKMRDIMDGNDWSSQKGDKRISMLQKNISMAPMRNIASNLIWDDLPQIQRVNGTDPYEWSAMVYAADLHDGKRFLRATASAPLEQVAMERPVPLHIGSTGQVRLAIQSIDWGTPTDVRAVLYLPDGTTKELTPKDDEIDLGKLSRTDWYMIHIHADFGEKGWIEWVMHLSE